MKVYISNSPPETKQLGRALGKNLKAGDVVTLDGELGAGKTVFTSGIAEALGYSGYVTSPTYTIVNEYLGLKTDLFHVDAYRLDNPDEIIDIGLGDYLNSMGIVVIEWADRINMHIPADSIKVIIEKCGSGDDARTIRISCSKELQKDNEDTCH